LNYNASGSVCCDNKTENCTKYGRLYDWATAMALDTSCNKKSCASQISAKHRGICPSGWHIPSADDIYELLDFVGPNANKKLKATSGWNWNDVNDISGNGTDSYGFSALPGGSTSRFGNSFNSGEAGYWWSTSEYSYDSDGDYADYLLITYHLEYVQYPHTSKSVFLFSVRCVQD